MNKERFGVSISKNLKQKLEEYCRQENRTRSNMLETMIIAYDTIHKTKY